MQQFQQNQIRSNDTEIESIRIVHNNVKSFWSKHEKEFTQWWFGLANKDKLAFLLDVSPISPDLGFKPVPFDITHHIVPEMVPKALYDLSALFKEFTFAGEADAATPAIHKLGWARDPVEDCSLEIVAVAQLAFLRSQIRKGLLLDKRNEYPNQFVALIGEPLGKRIQKTKKPPAGVDRNKFMESQRRLSEYREAGVWCYVEEWNLLKQRLYIIVNALGIIADEFKSENLGKQSSGMKTVKANVGCTACGKLQSSSGAGLKSCTCQTTFYCNNECQSGDWENHKAKHHQEVARAKGCGNCKFKYRLLDPSISLKFCPCGREGYCSTVCQKSSWPAHKADHNKYMEKA